MCGPVETLMSSSNEPVTSPDEIGLYGRTTSLPSADAAAARIRMAEETAVPSATPSGNPNVMTFELCVACLTARTGTSRKAVGK